MALIFTFGLGARLYLTWVLPAWLDEIASIITAKAPVLKILEGVADPGHLPGYYLILKIYSSFSDHLFWLRTSSLLFFIFNVFLLRKIGEILKDRLFSLLLIFLYVFSGYFIVFDWQARMYTGVSTLIFASYLLLLRKRILFFTLVNIIGRYFDYAYFWYFIPLAFYISWLFIINKTKGYRDFLYSVLISSFAFLFWIPFLKRNYELGLT
ncbi:MAG: hypothetical protein Q7S03_02620 [bacterium]|nr:hypothetical protein [bacterium]